MSGNAASTTERLATFESIVQRVNGFLYRCLNDEAYTMLFMHGAVGHLTGHSPEAFLSQGVAFTALMHEEDAAEAVAAIDSAIERRVSWEVEYRLRRADGSLLWVHETGGGVHDESGRLLYLEGAILDISEKKALETQTAGLLDEVARTSHEIIGDTRSILRVLETLKLLALNARIEAARAGEHGAGFTVVAREIKTLADETGASAQSITRLMDDLQALLQARRHDGTRQPDSRAA